MCWLYNPKFCDDELCIKNCDKCPVADKIFNAEAEQEEKLKKWIERLERE